MKVLHIHERSASAGFRSLSELKYVQNHTYLLNMLQMLLAYVSYFTNFMDSIALWKKALQKC